jgi:hypothetical protein
MLCVPLRSANNHAGIIYKHFPGKNGRLCASQASTVMSLSLYSILRELRVQHAGRPYRVLYAFDPRRCALLLIGGNKTGRGRWYDEYVPLAEKLYDEHLETLRIEGRDHG